MMFGGGDVADKISIPSVAQPATIVYFEGTRVDCLAQARGTGFAELNGIYGGFSTRMGSYGSVRALDIGANRRSQSAPRPVRQMPARPMPSSTVRSERSESHGPSSTADTVCLMALCASLL